MSRSLPKKSLVIIYIFTVFFLTAYNGHAISSISIPISIETNTGNEYFDDYNLTINIFGENVKNCNLTIDLDHTSFLRTVNLSVRGDENTSLSLLLLKNYEYNNTVNIQDNMYFTDSMNGKRFRFTTQFIIVLDVNTTITDFDLSFNTPTTQNYSWVYYNWLDSKYVVLNSDIKDPFITMDFQTELFYELITNNTMSWYEARPTIWFIVVPENLDNVFIGSGFLVIGVVIFAFTTLRYHYKDPCPVGFVKTDNGCQRVNK